MRFTTKRLSRQERLTKTKHYTDHEPEDTCSESEDEALTNLERSILVKLEHIKRVLLLRAARENRSLLQSLDNVFFTNYTRPPVDIPSHLQGQDTFHTIVGGKCVPITLDMMYNARRRHNCVYAPLTAIREIDDFRE
ncbi:unnamed protein product [Aphanomyces euteiches]|nr:hypothetical protein LEN26_012138 [Aphanomyces euteiches]KAH9155941.1 hypothetical protein AeRB84_002135 [Aphanomyces euteiches]KAH9195083.1 hypothetical protein AeNC1_002929 [Aphanomyces euteiches]